METCILPARGSAEGKPRTGYEVDTSRDTGLPTGAPRIRLYLVQPVEAVTAATPSRKIADEKVNMLL
jgi:hypothetical protein